MIRRRMMASVAAFGLVALPLNGCGRDCNAPYHDGHVFTAGGDLRLQDGDAITLAFKFYPKKPYKLGFPEFSGGNPGITIRFRDSSKTVTVTSENFVSENSRNTLRAPSERIRYGPENPLELPIIMSREDIAESEMRISLDGYGSFLAPLSSEYLEVSLSLYPEIECFGDSDDTVYMSERARIDLR